MSGVVQRQLGRSPRAHNNRADYRLLGFSVRVPLPPKPNGLLRLFSGCANWAGSKDAPSQSSIVSRKGATTASPNWPPSL